ncbi:hypothetical protein J4227_07665 [Candidatus Woesearchaeota archaeon]|nr:hypothetical protein [Candidatus Woesearchaeota archaeon]
MPRGRPIKSAIRQALVEILFVMKKAYGYELYKVYDAVYPKATLRAVYYNLRKGVELGEFKINVIKSEKGEYSWGTEAEKTYYELGDAARAAGDPRVREYLEKQHSGPQESRQAKAGDPASSS